MPSPAHRASASSGAKKTRKDLSKKKNTEAAQINIVELFESHKQQLTDFQVQSEMVRWAFSGPQQQQFFDYVLEYYEPEQFELAFASVEAFGELVEEFRLDADAAIKVNGPDPAHAFDAAPPSATTSEATSVATPVANDAAATAKPTYAAATAATAPTMRVDADAAVGVNAASKAADALLRDVKLLTVPRGTSAYDALKKMLPQVKTLVDPEVPIVQFGKNHAHQSLQWVNDPRLRTFAIRASEAYANTQAAFLDDRGIFRSLFCAADQVALVTTSRGCYYLVHGCTFDKDKLVARWRSEQACGRMTTASMVPAGQAQFALPKEEIEAMDNTQYRVTVRNGTVLMDLAKRFPMETHLFNVPVHDQEDTRRSATANVVCTPATARLLAKEAGVVIAPISSITYGTVEGHMATLRTVYNGPLGSIFDAAHSLQQAGYWCRWRFGNLRVCKDTARLTLHDLDVLRKLPGISAVIPDTPIRSAAGATQGFSLDRLLAGPDDAAKAAQAAKRNEKVTAEDPKEDRRTVHATCFVARSTWQKIVEHFMAPAKLERAEGETAVAVWPKGQGKLQRRAPPIEVRGVGLFQVGLPAGPPGPAPSV